MTSALNTRASNLILGALVADAATMGMHWIYDQAHIKKLAPQNPEFRTPSASDYENVRGYFAHPNRSAGEQSQYGEQLLVLLQSLHDNDGQYSAPHYLQQFRTHFGYGGAYVGYIDHSTRDTLDNARRAEDDALAEAKAIPFDGDDSVVTALAIKALAIGAQYDASIVRKKYEEAVRITHNDDNVVAHGLTIFDNIQAMDLAQGAVDEQFPSTSKLPALIAVMKAKGSVDDESLYAMVDSAISVTSTHERALSYGKVCAGLMCGAVDGNDIEGIIQSGLHKADADISSAINSALAMKNQSVDEVTQHFGMACDLKYGVPSIIHNIATCTSFADAIRKNIYAGGDNCGRAMVLGAVLGAHFGVGGDSGIPTEWTRLISYRTTGDIFT